MKVNFITNKILILLISFLSFYSCEKRNYQNNKVEKDWEDFSGLNLKFKGVVYSIEDNVKKGNFHGRGITRINILESNTKSYDPRKKQYNYYCIIKDNKAELYDNHIIHTSIGDTIEIDTKQKTIKWLNKHKSKQIYDLSNGEVGFFEYIKENNLQKI
jgi:hypothetical protein